VAVAMLLLVVGDVGGVQHTVLGRAEVEERGLHAGEHVANLRQVDVAHHGAAIRPGHVVLDQDGPFQDDDLGRTVGGAHQHLASPHVGGDDDLFFDRPPAVGTALAAGTLLSGSGPLLLLLLTAVFGGGLLVGAAAALLAAGFLYSPNLDGLTANSKDLPLFDDLPLGGRFFEHRGGATAKKCHSDSLL